MPPRAAANFTSPSRSSHAKAAVCCLGRQKSLPANRLFNGPSDAAGDGLRIFVASDLHADYSDNMAWVTGLSTAWYQKDVLIVAGDVAETHGDFVKAMSELKERFHSVFYVPGIMIYGAGPKGIDFELGVETSPRVLDGKGIIPLFSWYHESFDKETDITSVRIPSLEMACKDFHACKWPQKLSYNDGTLAHYFDRMNEKNHNAIEEVQRNSSQVITFSHFLPRQELCPEKRMLFYPNLPKIIGSDLLEVRLRSIHGEKGSASACHVFGHTHFCWDAVLDGIRYVQAPLAYPRERKRRMNGGEDWLPFCIYHGGLTNTISPSFWSDYYSKNQREPDNTDLAPWVSKFYRR